ncbi:MAG TPA: SpoIIE family protein phosphatase [Bacteroidales bacterium]|nr:SpoIIE family protein phosphatase [Bacteroidales bacterium]
MKINQLVLRGIALLLLIIAATSLINSQTGLPYISNFTISEEDLTENYSLVQDSQGIIFTANRKGILSFDGEDWQIIKTPDMPTVLAISSATNTIYVGCRNTVGYLSKNSLGKYEFNSLSDHKTGFVSQIIVHNNNVYFLSDSLLLYVTDNSLPSKVVVANNQANKFMCMIPFGSQLFIDIAGKGLFSLKNNKADEKVKNFTLSEQVVFTIPLEKSTIIGASDNKLYFFDGKNVSAFRSQADQILLQGTIIGGKKVTQSVIAIATAYAGCIFIDIKTGKTIYTINTQNGLPDDAIYAIEVDQNNGIWLTHGYGLSRIDINLPVRNFSHYKGLDGKLHAIAMFKSKLYIGSTTGVLVLNEKKIFDVSTRQQTIKPIQPAASGWASDQPQVSAEKRGFWSKLFTKKINPENEKPTNKQPFARSEKSIKIFKQIAERYEYEKVQGINSRCKQLIVYSNHLLAYTTNGLYEISGNSATQILSGNDINYLIPVNDDKALYVCTEKGIKILKDENGKLISSDFEIMQNQPVYSLAKDMFDNYWFGLENKVIKIKVKNGKIKEKKAYNFNSDFRERIIVRISNKKPVFFLSDGVYSIFNDSIQPNLSLSKYINKDSKVYFPAGNHTYINSNNQWIKIEENREVDSTSYQYLGLFSNINQICSDKDSNFWVIDESTNVYMLNAKEIEKYKTDFKAFVKKFFSNLSGQDFALNNVTLERKDNYLKIKIGAPYYIKKGTNQYQIYIEKLMPGWSAWSNNSEFDIPLSPGKWQIQVRAKNILGEISEPRTISFNIKKPFYNSWWFYMLCIAALVGVIYLIIKFRERQLQHEKEVLEEKVRERTREIEKQKEEIELQRNKIIKINNEIIDSIRYAKRIQAAALPSDYIEPSYKLKTFVYYKPKDIVSGDFYWIKQKNDIAMIAAADCTGHGVPGGFLSMLGISFLNELAAIEQKLTAAEYLNMLRVKVKTTLSSKMEDIESKDGMDIAFCIVDVKNKKLQYAGANSPIYLVRQNELIQYDADKMPIGSFIAEKDSFTNHDILLQDGDRVYLFSDGYRDQMGGPMQKRLKTPGFKQLILQASQMPIVEQHKHFESFFEKWKGDNEQMDDILVMGFGI